MPPFASPPMPPTNLELAPTPALINQWAAEAGAIALEHFRDASRRGVVDRKADKSIVTAADKAVETFLVDRIRAAFPEHGMIGEEGARTASAPDAPIWIVDPIDGTSMFADRMPQWCVSIGVFKDGRPWRGAVHLPLTEETYWVDEEGRARLNDAVVASEGAGDVHEPTLLLTTHFHKQLDVSWPGRVLVMGAVAIDACLVARGAAAGVLSRPNIWDVAAAFAIAQAAGARLSQLDGSPVDFAPMLAHPERRPPAPLLLATPEFREAILSTVSRKAPAANAS
jgi:myo-inositol-1(or 4)-monophosphatase